MFLKLKDLLDEKDYKVTDEEVEKAYLNLGYRPDKKVIKQVEEIKEK